MIGTMIGRETRPMEQVYVQTVPTRSVTALATGPTRTRTRTLSECETRNETETTVLPAIETGRETRIVGTTPTEGLPRRSLHASETGRSTSAPPERSTTTTAKRKFLSGRSHASGSSGRRRESTSATEIATDVTETVIVSVIATESTIGNHTRLGPPAAVRRTDIPISIGLVMRLVIAAVATVMCRLELAITGKTTEIISPNNRCQKRLSREGIVMVS